ncbi:5'-nucleotidase C-terminal domain-containing protein [Pseudonocardia sp.]|uniref:bifunctional metallophosphatase/5'-nucleotidase n=1 Tax=Pseudonocardia sp. TaxID=60912 RepID=UPI00261B9248|nr:5'-nucleotidase C-terminal domain-containing protein [Pseudonocardia sp.]
MHPLSVRRAVTGTALALAVGAATLVTAPAASAAPPRGGFTLTILHNNDGESQLRGAPGQPDFGGIARFVALESQLERAAQRGGGGAITLSSGDNFLAGPEFRASLDKGIPFYDSIALDRIRYDALAIGNHEFDFGPDVLADFISGFGRNTPFLSANLDVSGEPRLARLAEREQIAASTVVREGRERIGVVGATTPGLASISSPRDVVVDPDVTAAVQSEVDALTERGINKIILISHLQSVAEDRELVAQLRDVDVVIAGGGDDLLANDGDLLVPGDEIGTDPGTGEALSYPLPVADATGVQIPVVTTAGNYKYLGRLVVDFDAQGVVTRIDESSGPVRVSGVAPDAVEPDRFVQRRVVDPVDAFVAELEQTVIAQSEVALDGTRAAVRGAEANLGNLLADALLDAGTDRADEFGVTVPQVALQNGGGIRNDAVIPAGPITELDTFDIAPFSNFVSVVPDVPRAQFKEILENAVSNVPADGRFAQVAGFRFTYDAAAPAQVVTDDGTVTTPGSRVLEVVLDDGTVIVTGGQVVDGAPISVATNDFSARGGDQYPFRGMPFTSVGVSYQQALADFITADDDLAGTVTAADYPEGGEGRITRLN